MWILSDVRRAIEIEQQRAKEPLKFKVVKVGASRGFLRLEVKKKTGSASGNLDETLEEARAWWPQSETGPSGAGIVKMVNPDDGQVVIRPANGSMIGEGADLWIYPVDFLQALRDAWASPEKSAAAMGLVRGEAFRVVEHPRASTDLPLRDAQKKAVDLTNAQIGLLHGPPGTGKTYTLGVNVARLLAGTNWRILVTGTTNTSVDEALLSIDNALNAMGRADLRTRLARLGSGFAPERYQGREHLLPPADKNAIEELRLHKMGEPDKKDVERWIAWRDVERSFRAKLKTDTSHIFGSARVIAATVASIFHNFDTYDAIPWNFLIADEASQLPAATAVMSATLADRTLFAGDPRQLPAVVQSEHPLCRAYLERTAFDVFEKTAMSVRLDEQSRMRPEICEVVSKVFYRGELKVARDKASDQSWLAERTFADQLAEKDADRVQPIEICRIDGESQWSPKYQGRIRYDSAVACAAAVERLVDAGVAEADIWVLTPYRAQRALLRNVLYAQKRKSVSVSTVHRAQGGERRVVLFDPVEAGSKFLNVV